MSFQDFNFPFLVVHDYTSLSNFCALYSNKDFFYTKNPRIMFHYRVNFAKHNSLKYYNKKYEDLTLDEKFELTYLIVNRNPKVAFFEFILESGFRNLPKNAKNGEMFKNSLKCEKILNNTIKNNTNFYEDVIIPKTLEKNRVLNINNLLRDKHDHDFYYYIQWRQKKTQLEYHQSYIKFKNAKNKSELNKILQTRKDLMMLIIAYRIDVLKYCVSEMISGYKQNNLKLKEKVVQMFETKSFKIQEFNIEYKRKDLAWLFKGT